MNLHCKNLLKSLTDIGFEKVGSFSLNGADLSFEPGKYGEQKEILYCFVKNNVPIYVGKTVKSFKERMGQYRRGHRSQKTNYRINKKIVEALTNNKKIDIYVLTFSEPQHHRGFRINLAAGLEDTLIAHVKDTLKSFGEESWNKAGTT